MNKTKTTTPASIVSPCVDICALDENDVCIGCYRHGQEISHWGGLSDKDKISVLEKTHRRARGELVNHEINT